MVSTRGVKFKFSEGEKVLCYEPDPTKAKVLYDSKVLKLVVSHDNRGRKVPEYLIHFFGWNNSWNRCVVEGFILPDNEENRNLQRKLAEEAALQLKGKSKRKLPPIIKGTLAKKECTDDGRDMDDFRHMEPSEYLSESEMSEYDVERTTEFEIPQPLKEQLEEDRCNITRKNKIVRIPCEHNVVSILESYVKHIAANLLFAAPPKNLKVRSEPLLPQDVESRLNFYKEVMDGVRVYFDFTLPHLLLYQQEQKQYYTAGTVCRPICGIRRESSSVDARASGSSATDGSSQMEQDATKTCITAPLANTPLVAAPVRGRPSLRNSSHVLKQESLNEEMTVNGSTSCISSTKMKGRSLLSKERKDKMSGPKRVLRSNDKQKAESSSSAVTDCGKKSTSETESSSHMRSESPVLSCSPPRHGRGTPKTTSRDVSQPGISGSSDVQFSCNLSPGPASSSVVTSSIVVSAPSPSINPPPPPPPTLNLSVTNSVCSSASSTRSSLSSPRFDYLPYQSLSASSKLSGILSWNMLPSDVYEQVPAPPSLIYGAQHLLRLFVKLPDLIYKMNIPKKKLVPLMKSLSDFLNYLSERRDDAFLPSAYVDANETLIDPNSNSCVSN